MNSRVEVSDKPFSRRKIFFPRELFIELTLSPKDVEKMLQWEKQDDLVTPIWFCNCERVLLVNWTKFEKWKKR
jgi:hypothetical protein